MTATLSTMASRAHGAKYVYQDTSGDVTYEYGFMQVRLLCCCAPCSLLQRNMLCRPCSAATAAQRRLFNHPVCGGGLPSTPAFRPAAFSGGRNPDERSPSDNEKRFVTAVLSVTHASPAWLSGVVEHAAKDRPGGAKQPTPTRGGSGRPPCPLCSASDVFWCLLNSAPSPLPVPGSLVTRLFRMVRACLKTRRSCFCARC